MMLRDAFRGRSRLAVPPSTPSLPRQPFIPQLRRLAELAVENMHDLERYLVIGSIEHGDILTSVWPSSTTTFPTRRSRAKRFRASLIVQPGAANAACPSALQTPGPKRSICVGPKPAHENDIQSAPKRPA